MLFFFLIGWELLGCIDSEITLIYCFFYHLIMLCSVILIVNITIDCVFVILRWLWLSHFLIFVITLPIFVITLPILVIVITIIPSLHLWVHYIMMLILSRSQHLWWAVLVYVLFIAYPSLTIIIIIIKRLFQLFQFLTYSYLIIVTTLLLNLFVYIILFLKLFSATDL